MQLGADNSYASGPLLAGPLLGQVSGDSARIWVQARDESPLTLLVTGPEGERELVAAPREADWLCVTFVISELKPETTYQYRLRSEHGETPPQTLRAAPPGDAACVRIAFGSCFDDYWSAELPIFDTIGRERVDAFVMLGDNCYFAEPDWQSEQTMMLAQLRNRNSTAFRRLCAATSTLAIYDDHDFGPNDADGNFVGRDYALSAFLRMWAQKSYGTAEVPGIFSSVRCGPVEIFLTDGRYHRGVGGKTLLGRAQLDWLLGGLRQSQAPVKLVASGSTVLAHHPFYHDWESWRRSAPDELDELVSTIERDELAGVLFMSGDLHMGQVRHLPGSENNGRRGPDLWDITSSPLTIAPYGEHVLLPEAALIAQVPHQHNYGLIEVDLSRSDAEVMLFLKDNAGQVLFRQAVPLGSLRSR